MDAVLSEYRDKSHNFTNLIFMASSLQNSMASFSVGTWPKNHVITYRAVTASYGTIKYVVCNHLLIFDVFKKYSELLYHTDEYLSIINSQFEGLNDRTKLGKQNIRVQRMISLKKVYSPTFPQICRQKFSFAKVVPVQYGFQELKLWQFMNTPVRPGIILSGTIY